MSDREFKKVNTAKHSKCKGDQGDVAGALIKLVHLLAQAAAGETLARPVDEVRIPMKTATDSDGKRPPVPIQSGHFSRGSNLAS